MSCVAKELPAIVIINPSFADFGILLHLATRPIRIRIIDLNRGWFSGAHRRATQDPRTDRHQWWRR